MNLISNGWFLGVIMLLTLKISIILVKSFNRMMRYDSEYIHKQDKLIELIVTIIFFGVPFIAEFYFGARYIFIYSLIFALVGICCEFLFDFIWYRTMGTRLYRYYKGNLSGFTSWYIFPYWAAAGLFFLGFWQIIHYMSNVDTLPSFSTVSTIKDLSLLALTTFLSFLFIIAFRDYFKGRLSNLEGFRWTKYSLIVLTIWVPIIYLLVVLNSIFVVLYFVLSSIVGLILEGILSNKLRSLYGESFWLYFRYDLFNQGTSLLVLPIWGAAALLAFLLMNFFFF